MSPKPIRIFYSPLSQRFYASKAWRESGEGLVTITGEKFDVTNDIAELIERHGVTFAKRGVASPGHMEREDAFR